MHHASNKVLKLTALAIGCISFISVPVVAQERAAALDLEEVVVTAQKREESLQDIPISVAAFAREELEALGVYEVGQIAEYTANLQINRQPSSMDNFGFGIRGVSTGETSLLNENTVGLYLDGVYVARSTGSVFDLVDLERIEVLRGAQGTLYGRNTIGGAINIITEKPLEEFGFKQHFAVGKRDLFRSKSTLDTGIFGNGFAAKLTYNYNEKGGLVNNSVHGNKLGEQESSAYRIALRWAATDNFVADYTYDNSERDNNSTLSQIVATRSPNNLVGGAITQQATAAASQDRLNNLSVAFSPEKLSFSDIEMHTLTLVWDINKNVTFKSITAHRDWDSGTLGSDFGSFPSDGATVLNGTTGQLVPEGEYVSVFRAERASDNEQFTQEFQLLGNMLESRLQYTLGLYYFEEKSNEDNPQWFVLPAEFIAGSLDQGTRSFLCADSTFSNPAACIGKDMALSAPLFQYGSDNESIAAYGHFTYSATESLDVTIGLRYTRDDKKAYLRNGRINDGATNNAADDWGNTSGSITLNYAWTDDVRTYTTVSTGYRSGGFGARVGSAEAFQQGFDEETVTNYELGLKSDWFDSRMRLNGALFYMEYKDQQVNSFQADEGGASSVVLNAGELEIKGLELELTALLTDGLRLMLNYGYTDAEYNKFLSRRLDPITALPNSGNAADPVTGVEDISDVAVAQRAFKHNGSAILAYDFEPFSWGEMSARVEATYRDKMAFHEQLNYYDSTEDQTLINARVKVGDIELFNGRLSLATWGKNLTDEEYREWGIDFSTLGFAINTFQEKRSYGLDFVYEFGR